MALSPSQILSEKIFGTKALEDFKTSATINDFLSGHNDHFQTRKLYSNFMKNLAAYSNNKMNLKTDELVAKIQRKELDVYAVLKDVLAFLGSRDPPVSHNTRIHMLKIIKNFFETQDGIEISIVKLKLRVKPGKREGHEKEAMERKDVIAILNAAQDIRVKTYLHFLGATGARASESLSVRNKDIDFEKRKVLFRAKYTKTGQDRYCFLTRELMEQIKIWQTYKYRPHRSSYLEGGKLKRVSLIPKLEREDLLFAAFHFKSDQPATPTYIYNAFERAFAELLNRIGKGDFEDDGKRHKLTLHSFRRFVKSTISDLGYADFSEWYLGHNSKGLSQIYYKKSEKEKRELFESKIESSLTYTDVLAIERHHADVQSQLETLGKENESLRKSQQAFGSILVSTIDQLAKQSKGGGTFKIPIELFEQAGLDSNTLTTDEDAKKRHIADFKEWGKKRAEDASKQ